MVRIVSIPLLLCSAMTWRYVYLDNYSGDHQSFKKNKNIRNICTSSFSLLDPCRVSCFLQYGVQLGWSKVLAAPV
jgi:hypothetical protein